MKAVADSGVKLDKRVRLILGGDEEAGEWSCMKRYRQTEELPSLARYTRRGVPNDIR